MYWLLRFLPKNQLSYWVGRLAEVQFPSWLQQRIIRVYAARYGANLDEASQPLSSYTSLAAFFRRDLQAGARPIGEGIVSPVDGKLVQFGPIEAGQMIQAKGKFYTAGDLLGDALLGEQFAQGYFMTIYLAPGDYHHIHAPVGGSIVRAIHVPGALWPVNEWSVETIDRLFCINERITTVLDSAVGKVAVVKVGATNVGSITTTYNDFVGNQQPSLFNRPGPIKDAEISPARSVERGERLGSFRMGSTVVVLFERVETFSNAVLTVGSVRLGEQLVAGS